MCLTDAPRPTASGVDPSYEPAERAALLKIAFSSIEHGLTHRAPLPLRAEDHVPALRERRATFVTLEGNQGLRGCIGSLEACKPLARDVADNAYASAFSDPRFAPLARSELPALSLCVSILSPLQPLRFDSEPALLAQLRPHVDGLMLEEGEHFRSTFLPIVWQSLPRPEAFVRHLKLKAGLAADYWSDTLRVSRYVTESIKGRREDA